MNSKLMEMVRAVVRPVVTLSGWGAIIFMLLDGQDVPEWFQVVVVGLSTWWFASRQAEEKKP